MKTATVRDVRDHLSKVVVAEMPDFLKRSQAILGKKPKEIPLSEAILKEREERL